MSSKKKKPAKKRPDVRIPPHETEGSWSIGDLEKRKKEKARAPKKT